MIPDVAMPVVDEPRRFRHRRSASPTDQWWFGRRTRTTLRFRDEDVSNEMIMQANAGTYRP
jgi:hypothetical protein